MQARDPNFEARVRASFARQGFMKFIGATITKVEPGICEVVLPYREELSQQHGYFHGGVIGTLADNCGGYAAFSLMSANDSVLTVEYKVNIVAPGAGDRLIARAQVIRPGKTLSVVRTDVFAVSDDAAGEATETLCAASQMTLMRLADTHDGPRVQTHSNGPL